MAETARTDTGSPNSLRWRFSLRQMFVAVAGIAILFGWVTWDGWVKSDAVAYLSIAFLASVFSRGARRAVVGACVIFVAFLFSAFLADFVFGPHCRAINPLALLVWAFVPILFLSAVVLRLYARATVWSLLGSLILIELYIAAMIIYSCGCITLFQALASEYHVLNRFPEKFPEQRWYIIAPWLLGTVAGEIIARRRKPSSGVPQEI
jgi:hypothetical protein